MRSRNVLVIPIALTTLWVLAGCLPEDGGGGAPADRGNQSLDCDILRPSAPYGIKGPNRDGANFYSFVSRADGDVTCTGKMAEISVTGIFHYKTNGEQGAIRGATNTCINERRCSGTVDYRRGRLYCYEPYLYDDYAQVTAVFKPTAASPPKRVNSREGRHKIGKSYKPVGVCKQ